MAHDLEDDGLDIERLIGVLAETAKSAATSRTNAIAACRQVNDSSRGRWGGIARSGVFRWWLRDAARGGNSACAVSNSSSASSSWAISVASFSEERPKCIRFSRAIWTFSFSINRLRLKSALSAALRAARSGQAPRVAQRQDGARIRCRREERRRCSAHAIHITRDQEITAKLP